MLSSFVLLNNTALAIKIVSHQRSIPLEDFKSTLVCLVKVIA